MKKIANNLVKTMKRFHGEPGPSKAQKMSERQIWINVENPDGYYERIRGEIGKSLFEALRSNKSYVGGHCNATDVYNIREKPVEPNANSPYCKLCYVEIGKEWFNKIDMHDLERKELYLVPFVPFSKYKRFACCITLEPWMNELSIRIPYPMPKTDDDIIDE